MNIKRPIFIEIKVEDNSGSDIYTPKGHLKLYISKQTVQTHCLNISQF